MNFLKDNKAFGNIIYGAVGLTIFVIMIASVVMPALFGTNTVGWGTANIALWGILPLVVVASAIMFVIGKK